MSPTLLTAPVLRSMWLPISSGSQLKEPIYKRRLLNQDLMLWDSAQGWRAWLDRCPHRGAKLSDGQVDDHQWLVCPYHGLAFDANGICQHIPSQPDLTPPKQLHLQPLPVQERYGLIWVALDPPKKNLPLIPQWESSSYRHLLCGPYFYQASAYRAVENFLDVAHFPFVHHGLLGDRECPEIAPYSVESNSDQMKATGIGVIQPNPDGTGQACRVTYQYQVEHPLMVSLSKITPTGELTIFLAVTPLSETQCFGWMGLMMNYGDDIPLGELQRFQDKIVAQDIPIVESQSPPCPSLSWQDEYPLASDKLVIAYRKWLKQLGVKFGLRQ